MTTIMTRPPQRSDYENAGEFLGAWAAFTDGREVPPPSAGVGQVVRRLLERLHRLLLEPDAERGTTRQVLLDYREYSRVYRDRDSFRGLPIESPELWQAVRADGLARNLLMSVFRHGLEEVWSMDAIRQEIRRMTRRSTRVAEWGVSWSDLEPAVTNWECGSCIVPVKLSRLHLRYYPPRCQNPRTYRFDCSVLSRRASLAGGVLTYLAYRMVLKVHGSAAVDDPGLTTDFMREIRTRIAPDESGNT